MIIVILNNLGSFIHHDVTKSHRIVHFPIIYGEFINILIMSIWTILDFS